MFGVCGWGHPADEVPFCPSLRNEDLQLEFRCIWQLPGSHRMRSGRTLKIWFMGGWRTLEAKSIQGSACVSNSDSIGEDIRVPSVPNGEGQRQTQIAGLTGASIPCLQTPYSKQRFSFWNQPVPAISEDRLRQLKLSSACPEEVGGEMATLSHFSASLLDSAVRGSLQTETALSEANPEV